MMMMTTGTLIPVKKTLSVKIPMNILVATWESMFKDKLKGGIL